MMLDIIKDRNPALVRAAVKLHQSGEIPADCYVVDLDSVRQNVRSLRSYADELGLRLYAMTKQINRNPSMLKAIAEEGIDKFVTVLGPLIADILEGIDHPRAQRFRWRSPGQSVKEEARFTGRVARGTDHKTAD